MNWHIHNDTSTGSIAGVAGGMIKYFTMLNAHTDTALRMTESIVTAFLCAVVGIVAKHLLEPLFKNKKK